jgi:hypothetical protein
MSQRIKVKEEAPAVSVAAGGVPSLTNPSDVYALQIKKRLNKKILRRKPPKL